MSKILVRSKFSHTYTLSQNKLIECLGEIDHVCMVVVVVGGGRDLRRRLSEGANRLRPSDNSSDEGILASGERGRDYERRRGGGGGEVASRCRFGTAGGVHPPVTGTGWEWGRFGARRRDRR